MIKILFLCHGNICRSPMAQFVLADKVNKLGRSADFEIESKALSNEEVGNGIHYGTKAIFKKYHIPYREHYASRFTKEDYEYYDHIILMDHFNRYLIDRFIPYDKDHKISMLLKRDIEDPWYSGDFEKTYRDIDDGCDKLLDRILDDEV